MSDSKVAQDLVNAITQILGTLTVLARQTTVDRQMVDLLFAISHAHRPETELMLEGAKAALLSATSGAGANLSSDAKAMVDVYTKRIDDLLAIKKTGFKATIH